MKPLLLLSIALHCIALNTFGQTAHSDYLFWAYADSKEKVSVTEDKSKTYKYWDLSTGKLLYSFNANDPANNIKMLVNNIQQQSWQERNIKYSRDFKGDNTLNKIIYDGAVIAEFSNNTNNKQYVALHHRTKQVAVKRTENGITSFWSLRQNPADINAPFFEPIASFKDSIGRINSIVFSPSGKYIYAYFSGCIVDVAAKKVLWNDEAWDKREITPWLYAFNNAETKLATINKEGMVVLDVQTGAVLEKIPLPAQFKNLPNPYMFPCADMQTFIFIQSCFTADTKDCSKKAWLVKKDAVIELID